MPSRAESIYTFKLNYSILIELKIIIISAIIK